MFDTMTRDAGCTCFESDRCAIAAGVDCLDVLRRLPSKSIDVVFADPPYHLSNGGTTNSGGKRVAVHKGGWDVSRGAELDHAFHVAWLAEVQRALKPTGTLWVSGTQHVIFSIGYAMQQLGFHLLNTVSWCKTNPPPNLACRTFTHATELVIWAAPMRSKKMRHYFAYRDMKDVSGTQMLDWWVMPTVPQSERAIADHTTQKPEGLLDRIILASSLRGDIVLDPFMGSGTTGVMAMRLGRRFIGVELDEKMARAAAKRIAMAPRGPTG